VIIIDRKARNNPDLVSPQAPQIPACPMSGRSFLEGRRLFLQERAAVQGSQGRLRSSTLEVRVKRGMLYPQNK
jgi:hypothetical protein